MYQHRQDVETYILNGAVRVIRKQRRIIANRKEQKRKMKNYKEYVNIERTKAHKANIWNKENIWKAWYEKRSVFVLIE